MKPVTIRYCGFAVKTNLFKLMDLIMGILAKEGHNRRAITAEEITIHCVDLDLHPTASECPELEALIDFSVVRQLTDPDEVEDEVGEQVRHLVVDFIISEPAHAKTRACNVRVAVVPSGYHSSTDIPPTKEEACHV